MKRWLYGFAALTLVLLVCFISLSPSVPLQPRATAQDIATSRFAFEQVKDARGKTTRLALTADDVAALAVLLREASGYGHATALLDNGTLSAEASLPLVAGLWLNTAVTANGKHTGFPPVKLTVGNITFPAFLSRWGAASLRMLLKLKGVNLPPLDTMVQQLDITPNKVTALVHLPKSSGLVEQAVAAAGEAVNDAQVARIYCQLYPLAADKQPFVRWVNTAFAQAPAANAADYNRSAFIALAFHVVGERAYTLAPDALELVQKCLPKGGEPKVTNAVLASRADLAKHWSLTAALTAKLGAERAVTLGELKELKDSLKGGSGFSFVDLAANRSGLRAARYGLNPGTAARTAQQLATADDAALVPLPLRQGTEGLSAKEFIDQFGALDESRYTAAAAQIDQQLTFPAP